MLPIRDMNNWVIQELLLVDLGKNDKDNNRDHGSHWPEGTVKYPVTIVAII